MKLNQIINEAARFGNRERTETLRNIQNFRFGLEYEFNMNDGVPYLDKISPVYAPEDDERLSVLMPYLSKIFRTYVQINDHGGASTLDEFVGDMQTYLLGEPDEAEVHYFETAVVPDVRDMSAWFLSGVYRQSEKVKESIKGVNLNGYCIAASVKPNEMKAMQQVVQIPNHSTLNDTIAMNVRTAAQGLSRYLTNDCDHVSPRMTERSYVDGVISIIHAEQTDYNKNTPSKIDIARRDLQNPLIRDILPDVSVPNGVEVITRPLSFRDTVEFMDEIFSYIDKKGSTDQSTGLHVNISTTGMPINRVNFVKMMTLLDVDFYQNMSPNSQKLVKYPVRGNWVTPITRFLGKDNGAALLQIAQAYAYNGIDSFISKYEQLVTADNQKERAVNMTHLLNADVNQRRVELRFLGGPGYQHRREEIVDDILRFCFMISAGADEQFMHREYLENIVRILDRAVRLYDVNGQKFNSFSSLVNFVRKQ